MIKGVGFLTTRVKTSCLFGEITPKKLNLHRTKNPIRIVRMITRKHIELDTWNFFTPFILSKLMGKMVIGFFSSAISPRVLICTKVRPIWFSRLGTCQFCASTRLGRGAVSPAVLGILSPHLPDKTCPRGDLCLFHPAWRGTGLDRPGPQRLWGAYPTGVAHLHGHGGLFLCK